MWFRVEYITIVVFIYHKVNNHLILKVKKNCSAFLHCLRLHILSGFAVSKSTAANYAIH